MRLIVLAQQLQVALMDQLSSNKKRKRDKRIEVGFTDVYDCVNTMAEIHRFADKINVDVIGDPVQVLRIKKFGNRHSLTAKSSGYRFFFSVQWESALNAIMELEKLAELEI